MKHGLNDLQKCHTKKSVTVCFFSNSTIKETQILYRVQAEASLQKALQQENRGE